MSTDSRKSDYDEEMVADLQYDKTTNYDDKYILKRLMEGISREELAQELDHKSYRTLDMYMRRRGYKWDGNKQTYVLKSDLNITSIPSPITSKTQRILSLFKAGIDPREIAKRVGMKDHRAIAIYMKSKGYIWSSKDQNYVLIKGEVSTSYIQDSENNVEIETNEEICDETLSEFQRLEKLIPMLEMMERNKDKLIELLAINEAGTIPRFVVGGITITKSLSMSHSLSELVKEFSKEKNISQKEIFEVAIIEFLKKYGYESEINSLFI